MSQRFSKFVLSVAFGFLLIAAVACNERGDGRDILTYTPPTEDAGTDASVDNPPVIPIGPPCAGRDGENCRPPSAFGICLEGQCQRIACVSGFIDCDSDPINGCETRVDSVDDCGACGVTCPGGAACQFGDLGYTCASEVVCRLPRFDVDLSLQNGCEWNSAWGEGFSAPTEALDVDHMVATPFGILAAAQADGLPVFATLPELEQTPVGGVASGPAVRLSWDENEQEVLGTWPESVVRWDAERAPTSANLPCTIGRDLRDVTPHPVRTIVAFESGLITWETRALCTDCEIAGDLFEREDYLRAFWRRAPGAFEESEISRCDPCSFDPSSLDATDSIDCAPNACRPNGTPSDCTGCDPSSCPSFEPLRVFSNGVDNRVYVVTTRGVVVLRYGGGWQTEWRLELPWDPDSAGGTRILDAAMTAMGGSDVVTLLDNAGRLSAIEFSRSPGEPPAPLPAVGISGGEAVHVNMGVRVVPTGNELTFVGVQDRSAAIRRIGAGDGPALAGLQHVASTPDETGFTSLYLAPGVFFLRTFSR